LHTPVAVCYTKIEASSKIFFNTVANTGSIEVPFTEVHRKKERKKERKKQTNKQTNKLQQRNGNKADTYRSFNHLKLSS